jgi:hypothetical protein
MQNASWAALLQRIPPEQQYNLMLVTNNGIEISIQCIIRAEEDYLVLRGRMAGSDLGRTLFMPYDRMTYIGFQKAIKEIEVRAMFGESPNDAAPAAELQPGEPAPAPEATAVPAPAENVLQPSPAAQPTAPAPAAGARRSSARIPLPSKNAMLERLRARSQAGNNKPLGSP